MDKHKNKQGWVIVDGVHCCYCQLAEYACPKHSKRKGSNDNKEQGERQVNQLGNQTSKYTYITGA